MGLVFLIHSATPCPLIEEFSPFTFKAIIDRYIFMDIFLFVLWLFCSSSVPFLALFVI